MKKAFKVLFCLAVCTSFMVFSGCEYILNDLIAFSNTASWNNSSHSEILVSFADNTYENKRIDLNIHTLSDYGSCSENSRSSTTKTMIIKLTRGLNSGENVTIYWRDSWESQTLYVD